LWQKLTLFSNEQARHESHPLYLELVRVLRREGARGATNLRGIWGFSGDHPPHGDRLFRLRREVPVVTTVIDRPAAIQRWFDLFDAYTTAGGLVTSELVPAAYLPLPGATGRPGFALARLAD
jgi:PII-like signaling protein